MRHDTCGRRSKRIYWGTFLLPKYVMPVVFFTSVANATSAVQIEAECKENKSDNRGDGRPDNDASGDAMSWRATVCQYSMA